MDEETSRAWNKWFDQRLHAALEIEREIFERRLAEVEVKIIDLVTEAFKVNVTTSTQFVADAVEHGIRRSAAHAEKLLTEFHAAVQSVLDGRERRDAVSGPREGKTTLN